MKSANSVFCLQLNRIKDLNRLFTSKNGARPFLQVAISNSEMSNACRLVAPSALRVNLYLRCNSGRGLKPRAQACFCGLGSASPRRTGFCDKCSQPNQTEPAQRRACIQTRTAPFRAGAMEHRDRVTPEYGHSVPLQNATARRTDDAGPRSAGDIRVASLDRGARGVTVEHRRAAGAATSTQSLLRRRLLRGARLTPGLVPVSDRDSDSPCVAGQCH